MCVCFGPLVSCTAGHLPISQELRITSLSLANHCIYGPQHWPVLSGWINGLNRIITPLSALSFLPGRAVADEVEVTTVWCMKLSPTALGEDSGSSSPSFNPPTLLFHFHFQLMTVFQSSHGIGRNKRLCDLTSSIWLWWNQIWNFVQTYLKELTVLKVKGGHIK